ncbi:WXG100 family type VII secretion target [Streptomyces sp. NPDC001514]
MAITPTDINGDGYVSDNEAMLACVERLLQVNTQLNNQLTTLDTEIRKTLDGWQSEGSDGESPKEIYNEQQAIWDQSARELNDFLNRTAQSVERVVETYRGGDKMSARALQG